MLGSPRGEEVPRTPPTPAVSFHPPKPKKQAVGEFEGVHRLPATPGVDVGASKKGKEDVVVPPINVLIVEGE
jgi:hypothetical protein